jgi:hypothetical protein
MASYLKILKGVGVALIFLGVLDIVWMVYCIVNMISYSSSFLNIAAIVGGVLLYRGNLKAAWIVAFFCVLAIGFGGAVFILLPLFYPVPYDLVHTYIKLDPMSSLRLLLLLLVAVLTLILIYCLLTTKQIFDAMAAKGIDIKGFWKKPRIGLLAGFVVGIVFGSLIFALVTTMMNDEMTDFIEALAVQQTGQGYKYYISGYKVTRCGGVKTLSSKVIAYNDTEIKEVPIFYKEEKSP